MGNRFGIIIVSCFAALWLVFAKLNDAPIGWVAILGGACFSAFLIMLSFRQKQDASAVPADERKRAGRIYMWSSIGEGVGIFIAINVLLNLGMADRYMAGIAIVVGLHFIPIALKLPRISDLFLTAIFMVIGLLGFFIPSAPHAALFVGCMSAATLWAAVGVIIYRMRVHTISS